MAGGQSPPLPGGPGCEEYRPGWTRFCHSSTVALPPSDPVVQASLTTTHNYASLHAALPVPKACVPSWHSSGFWKTRPCLLLEEPPGFRHASSHNFSFLIPTVRFRLNSKSSWPDKKPYLTSSSLLPTKLHTPQEAEKWYSEGTLI